MKKFDIEAIKKEVDKKIESGSYNELAETGEGDKIWIETTGGAETFYCWITKDKELERGPGLGRERLEEDEIYVVHKDIFKKISEIKEDKKSTEDVVKGIKCDKCGNEKYIVKDCGFTQICTECKTIYKD